MNFEQGLAITVPTIGAVGLIVAYLGHRILKQNAELSARISRKNAELSAALAANVKLAEFRQNWIDCLRNDMAEFQKASMLFYASAQQIDTILQIGGRIELRMNPADDNLPELRSAMAHLRASSNAEDAMKQSERFIAVCQVILKNEWEVLKKDLQKLDRTNHDD